MDTPRFAQILVRSRRDDAGLPKGNSRRSNVKIRQNLCKPEGQIGKSAISSVLVVHIALLCHPSRASALPILRFVEGYPLFRRALSLVITRRLSNPVANHKTIAYHGCTGGRVRRLASLFLTTSLFLVGFLICGLGLKILCPVAYASTIEFPESELPTETVLPVFDKTVVVRDRRVKTAGKLEVGVGGGLNLAEPLYNQTVFNITSTYHFSETNGVNIFGLFLSSGLSQAGQDLKNGIGLVPPQRFDASLAPTVQDMFFGNYELTAYYGKISLTKQTVMNLSLYGLAGGGLVQWSDHSTFGFDAGIGQKLWFTRDMGLRVDLLVAMYMGPDPTNPDTPNKVLTGGTKLGSSQFSSTYYMRPFMTVDYIYLF